MQTSEKKTLEVLIPILKWSPLAHNATKIAKVNRFSPNRPTISMKK